MELNEYQERAMSTCMDSSHNYTYMAEGLVAEVGEFLGKVAKGIRKGYVTIQDNQLKVYEDKCTDEMEKEFCKGLLSELGDVLWFVAGLARELGVSLDTIAVLNLNKLSSRKVNGTIDGNGDGVTKEERGK